MKFQGDSERLSDIQTDEHGEINMNDTVVHHHEVMASNCDSSRQYCFRHGAVIDEAKIFGDGQSSHGRGSHLKYTTAWSHPSTVLAASESKHIPPIMYADSEVVLRISRQNDGGAGVWETAARARWGLTEMTRSYRSLLHLSILPPAGWPTGLVRNPPYFL